MAHSRFGRTCSGLLFCVFLIAFSSTPGLAQNRFVASATMQAATPTPTDATLESTRSAGRVIELTNLERASAGLPPLKANASLSQAAQAHSQAMAERNFFDHRDPVSGSDPAARVRTAGYGWSLVGENIGLGYPTAEEAVIAWMSSQGHRENILNPVYRETGVGYVQDGVAPVSCQHQPCRHYWTQNFGARSDQYPIVINDEAEATASPQVSLYIYGQGWAQEMRLRSDAEPFGNWESYAAHKTWQLPEQPGLHSITVELRNEAGEVLSAQDEVFLQGVISSQTPVQPTFTPAVGVTSSAPAAGSSSGTEPVRIERHISPDNPVAGQEVQINFKIIGDITLCGEQEVRTPLDVALVIDHSGSMGDMAGTGISMLKLDAAKQAAVAFMRAVELGTDQVAVIGFDDRAQLQHELDAKLDPLITAIEQLQVAGGTNIADGILAGHDELTSNRHRQDAAAVLILLSDGQSSSAQSAAQQAKARDIRIVTIGLGSDVDENELRLLASAPTDYYFSPDASQLETIFLEIARSIRKVPAATNLVLTHRLDVTNFEVIPDSIKPQGQHNFDRIIWRVPMLGEDPIELSYRARTRVAGDFDADLGDGITYQRCGQATQTTNLLAGLPVKVQADPNATPTPIPTPMLPPLPPGQAFMAFVCGDFPWWLALALLLLLILLPLIWWRNLGNLRQRWTARKECARCCLLNNLALLAYTVFLISLLIGQLKPLVCQPREAIYFWQITPDGDSAIYYKPIEPYLPVREFRALSQKADCIACHSTALESDIIAAVADGGNGPVSVVHLDGTPVSIPAITASYVAVSPDGKQVAYAFEGKDIYILDIESGSTVALPGASDPGVIETMPTWSPDGQTIAFVRALGEVRGYALAVPCDIYTIPAAGGVATVLPGAGGDGFNYYPSYSPDGRWLAFTRHTTGSSTRADPQAEIYLIPAQGGQAQRLAANDLAGGQTLAGASNSWPTWSPDSRSLAFNTKRNSAQFDIYIAQIDPDGKSGVARPLSGASRLERFEHLPQWGRPPRVNLLSRLLGLLLWLIPLVLLWLARRWTCRPRQYSHTLTLTGEVTPESGIVNQQTFNVKLTLVGDNKTCDEVRIRKPVDVLLVLDISGSMADAARPGLGERKINGAKSAAKAFIQRMDPDQDRVGLIPFDEKAEVIHSLGADPVGLEKALDGLDARGGTAIHDGLAVALDEMKALRRAGIAGAIVLLSDGGSAPEPALEQGRLINEEGIRLITVGFGQNADRQLLQQLATTPRDCHFSASNNQLEQIFLSIAQQIQEPIAATDITFMHRVSDADFELDHESIYPRPQRVESGTIVWYLSELGSVPRHFRYQVAGKKVAERINVDLSDTVRYKRCGDLPMELPDPRLGLPVTVQPIIHGGHRKKVAKPPEPLAITPRSVVWEPDAALIVGVGTFGRHVLTHLKKNLRDAGAGVIPDRVRFLLIDTAKYLASGRPLGFAGVVLDDDEVCVLNENLSPVFTKMREEPQSHAELRPWLQPEANVGAEQMRTLAEGTHGRRPLARAGLLRSISGNALSGQHNLTQRLTELLKAVNQPPHGVRVILAGSLSEGMGATLADLAYLGRTLMESQATVTIEGYFGMERQDGTNEPAIDQEKNALVSLRELTWFQRNPDFEQRFNYGDQNQQFKPLHQRLIDDLYLFPTKLGVLAQAASPAVADVITLRLDAKARRVTDKDWFDLRRTNVAKRELEEQQVCYGTAGSFVIRLPAFDLMDAVAVRWARDVIQYFLMGQRRDQLAFAAQFNIDSNLPADPATLVNGFFEGFERGDYLYQVDTPIPNSVRALNEVRQHQPQGAFKLAPISSEEVRAYLNSVLQLMLMGIDDSQTTQPRAGKIGYVGEFLEALGLECQGNLKQLIAQSGSPSDVRHSLEMTRDALAQQISMAIEQIGQIKTFLGQIYGKLEDRARDLAAWHTEMDQVRGRLYVWQKALDPAGKPLPAPRDLSDMWYEEACSQAAPEKFATHLIWAVDAQGRIDLRLNRPDSRLVGSTESTPDDFVASLLAFADSRLQDLWKRRSLATVSDDAVALLHSRFEADDQHYDPTNSQQTIEKLSDRATIEGGWQSSFETTARVERSVIAACLPLGEALQALTNALPPPAVQSTDPTQWDWPRLALTDRFGWQLVRSLDVLSLPDLLRYQTILQSLENDATPRAVFPWEAVAAAQRDRFGGTLLHPVVAATLVNEERANLYALAFVSDWIASRDGRWHLGDSRTDPILSWTTTPGWNGAVYGLLHFTFSAKDAEVEHVEKKLQNPTDEIVQKWSEYRQREPAMLQEPTDKHDLYSLRLLAWSAVGDKLRALRNRSA